MASLFVYIVSSLLLLALGLWHFCSSSLLFVKSPREFCARPWHPFPCLPWPLKQLPLWLQVLALVAGIVYEAVTISQTATYNKLIAFQHVAMLTVFVVVVMAILATETSTAFVPLPSEASFLLAAVGFACEWMAVAGEAGSSLALEGECWRVLSKLAAICCASCLLLAWRPRSFLPDTVLSAGIILQGTWIMQTGLSLLAEPFIPEGCHRIKSLLHEYTQCDLEDSKARAVALIDLAFICHIIVVMILCLAVFGLIAKGSGCRRSSNYDMLQLDGETDGAQMMKPLAKIDVD